jgi:hypothetical protein
MVTEDECEVFGAALALFQRRAAVKCEAYSEHGRQNEKNTNEQEAHRRA